MRQKYTGTTRNDTHNYNRPIPFYYISFCTVQSIQVHSSRFWCIPVMILLFHVRFRIRIGLLFLISWVVKNHYNQISENSHRISTCSDLKIAFERKRISGCHLAPKRSDSPEHICVRRLNSSTVQELSVLSTALCDRLHKWIRIWITNRTDNSFFWEHLPRG